MSLSLIEGIVNSPYCTSTLIQFNSNKTFVQRQVMSDCILQDRGLHHNDIIVNNSVMDQSSERLLSSNTTCIQTHKHSLRIIIYYSGHYNTHTHTHTHTDLPCRVVVTKINKILHKPCIYLTQCQALIR